MAPKDVHTAVVRSHFEKNVLRSIPLVKQFFHEVTPITQSETNRTLIPFVAGVADYFDLHPGTPPYYTMSSCVARIAARLSRKSPLNSLATLDVRHFDLPL